MAAYPSGHNNAAVAELILILDDWAHAMDDNSILDRKPDVGYTRATGKEDWTEDELDIFVRNLDAEFDQEVTRLPGTAVGAVRGPGFVRLPYEQRLALAQVLDQCFASYQGVDFPSSTDFEYIIDSGYFKSGDYVSPTYYEIYEPDRSYMDRED